MMMNFDSEGHIVITPHQLFQLAIDNPTRLVDHYLIKGTPHAFRPFVFVSPSFGRNRRWPQQLRR